MRFSDKPPKPRPRNSLPPGPELSFGTIVLARIGDDRFLMKLGHGTRWQKTGRPGDLAPRYAGRRVSVDVDGRAKLGVFRISLRRDQILAVGDAALDALGLKPPLRW
jgi:hypothetical protein